MVTWNNLNKISAFAKVKEAARVDLTEAMKGDNGAERVKNYSTPMAAGLAYNYASKQVDDTVLAALAELAKENRIKAIPLSVSTAFHSPMMIPAAEKLKDVLRQAELKMPEITVYADVTADDIMKDYDGGDLKDYLVEIMAKQAMSPVYWEEIIRRFEADGVKAIIEVGPGATLSGLTKKTCKEIAALNVENVETLQETIAQLKELV